MTRMFLRMVAVGLIGLTAACTDSGPDLGQSPSPGNPNLTAPAPDLPQDDALLDTLRPTLTVRNGTSSQAGNKTYEFQISDRTDFSGLMATSSSSFDVVVSQTGVVEDPDGTTSFTVSSDLQPATRMYWRARLVQGSSTSAWSSTARLRTKFVGFNRPGELYDPLMHGETLGERAGGTTFLGNRGLQVANEQAWVRYVLGQTLTSGEISVEVSGLRASGSVGKSRIFSMMDGGQNLFDSKFLFNVQYRGSNGNPDNAISYKLLMGDEDLKYEPALHIRLDSVRALNPDNFYLWTATWGSTFRLTIREVDSGSLIYDRSHDTPGLYNPSPHTAYLGANDWADETGSYPGAIFRNLWVGAGPRPPSLGSALHDR